MRSLVARGDLYLRDALANAQSLDERRKLLGKRREALEEYLAAAQVREIWLVALAKARKDAPLLVHVPHAEPRAASIGKCGTAQRLDHTQRLNAADALEVIEQLALFRGELSLRRQVLQGAAAAHTEMRAARRHAVGRGRQDVEQHGLFELAAPLRHAKAHPFARQRARDEHGLARHPRDAAAVVGEIHDVRLERLAGQLSGHAARNSCRCGALEASSNCRTRLTSAVCSALLKRPRSSSKRK